ncbi:phage Gp37/Gp68 family protein [Aureimonas phyllosphaerae]|uniref:Protein gp37 n=1 Tax=Aureimonas phyllosphaerae TaxID=1166078 RepID=A0A7W6BZP7_9HYPH|nr:phage Gp37/Gp68 family protein [Aureimonas phyllosphaerae]MBB3937720.1 protein gp37 [Aureimonas phyllosphaerae]MBB3961745.1 protein gp37 [Aureimonas phyllosphaerae]SFF45419.1 protein gp37 [Aureimonas phyllosphaerae]
MADGTKIEWTDATWNPITGCAVVSPGCTNCYAMKLAGTRLKHIPSRTGLTRDTKAGPVWTGEIRFNAEWLDQPLRWHRPRMIFVCAHGDLFAEGVTDEMLDQVFAVMALAPQHTFQVLTKRPDRMRDYCRRVDERGRHPSMNAAAALAATGCWNTPALDLRVWPLPNVWLGVSAEDQRRADERIPALLDTPAAVRWVSAEPMLGPIDFTSISLGEKAGVVLGEDGEPDRPETFRVDRNALQDCDGAFERIDWIVVGGESGHGARPMHPDWARAIRDQCAKAEVPFLFKQWGEWGLAAPRPSGMPGDLALATAPPYTDSCPPMVVQIDHYPRQIDLFGGASVLERVGKKAAGRLLDGVQHDGYPPAEEILF